MARMRVRCEKCSVAFRPIYHEWGEACPLDQTQQAEPTSDSEAAETTTVRVASATYSDDGQSEPAQGGSLDVEELQNLPPTGHVAGDSTVSSGDSGGDSGGMSDQASSGQGSGSGGGQFGAPRPQEGAQGQQDSDQQGGNSEPLLDSLIRRIAREEASGLDQMQGEAIVAFVNDEVHNVKVQAIDAITQVGSAFEERVNAIESKVGQMVDEAIASLPGGTGGGTVTVTIVKPDGSATKVDGQHFMFPVLLRLMTARLNAYLVGGAGSGKTHSVSVAAEALGLGFYPKSMGPTTQAHELLGYMDAGGNYVPGLLWKPWTEGGVLLLDEIDAASAAAVTTLNSALANGYCSFPHGVYPKHPDCVFVAAGNTFGRGADRMYVGRTQLDAASLNRFFQLEWDYDERFELDLVYAMSGARGTRESGRRSVLYKNPLADDKRPQEAANYVDYALDVREAVSTLNIRTVVGTRDLVEGTTAIMRGGFRVGEVARMRFLAGLSVDDRKKIAQNVTRIRQGRGSTQAAEEDEE